MIEYTEITQNCTSKVVEGKLRYRIGMIVTEAGELPHIHLFLYQINDPDNQKLDSFVRVATIRDLHHAPTDRKQAVATPEKTYLSHDAEFYYDNVNVAVEAKKTLSDRINTVISAWVQYRDDFINTDGVSLKYPTADPGVVEAMIQVYRDSRSSREALEEDLQSAEVSIDVARTAISTAEKSQASWRTLEALSSAVSRNVPTYKDLIEIQGSEAIAFYNDTLSPSLNSMNATVTANINQASAELVAAQSSLSQALTAKEELQVQLDKARQAETDALAALYEADPSVDPNQL
jgi:hypothetical protein